jgi:tetratricopeptide (TPR) repeat protein
MHRIIAALVWLAAAMPFAAHAASSAEVLDLAGRVHYGYYHAEPRTIDAALAALDRLADSPEVVYYRDFAALRRAQLGGTDRAGAERLHTCAQRDVQPGRDKRVAAESWVLVAACAQVAGDEGRRDRALALARERDDDNPRIALVEAWAMSRSAGTDVAKREAAAAKLQAVVDAFETWEPSLDDPDWGYAEALTGLAAAALERGQTRTARDFIERALLLAPDYRAALDLRVALQGTRGGERRL